MAGPERRSQRRERVGYPVRVRADGEEFDGVVDNLGTNGALIVTSHLEAALDVGSTVHLEIDMGNGPVIADGEVLRIEQEFSEGDIRLSFAVKFAQPIALE
ncbi:MAG TPA: PilZ domain-containing protein [Planctomycetota bacterium]|nr:PilZ domain-containing protein [Planctomycetota bacterium]